MGPRARTIEDKQQRRRTILEAAKKLFFESGYQNTTIEKITEVAGVSTGTFYLYFKSKREIYMALYADGVDIFHQMAQQAISWPGMGVLGRLSAIANAYYRFYKEYTEYFDILAFIHLNQEELENPSDMRTVLDEKALKLLKMIEGVIKGGVESGELAPMDTWKATNVLWGMMDGLVMLAERQNVTVIEVSLEELIKQALEIAFYGMVRR
ncbi:TetR/AcrR family transcriptional regulator [Candidatus Poribacteria bacterium]|nr:TetR/AcrR family transcriptional regulator [Candidatus Poribacteria bacterium]